MENRFNFKLGFVCQCGEKDIEKFITSKGNNTDIHLLCGTCETRYILCVQSKKIPITMGKIKHG